MTKKSSKTVLSEKNQALLEELCEYFGTPVEEVRNDPDFVLEALLEQLNKDKSDISASLGITLGWAIDEGAIPYRREKLAEKAA